MSEHEESPEKIATIARYISRYCDSLTEINFSHLHTDIALFFKSPLYSVECVSFSRSQIGSYSCRLNHYLPYLQVISFFDWNCVADYCRLVDRYAFLERVYLYSEFFPDHRYLRNLVALNPGLDISFLREDDYDYESDN